MKKYISIISAAALLIITLVIASLTGGLQKARRPRGLYLQSLQIRFRETILLAATRARPSNRKICTHGSTGLSPSAAQELRYSYIESNKKKAQVLLELQKIYPAGNALAVKYNRREPLSTCMVLVSQSS